MNRGIMEFKWITNMGIILLVNLKEHWSRNKLVTFLFIQTHLHRHGFLGCFV